MIDKESTANLTPLERQIAGYLGTGRHYSAGGLSRLAKTSPFVVRTRVAALQKKGLSIATEGTGEAKTFFMTPVIGRPAERPAQPAQTAIEATAATEAANVAATKTITEDWRALSKEELAMLTTMKERGKINGGFTRPSTIKVAYRRSNNLTICLIKSGTGLHVSWAKRNPLDPEYVPAIGHAIAFTRALREPEIGL